MTASKTEHVQEQVLDAVRKGQELTVDAIKKVVETVSAAQAKLPATPFEGRLRTLPFADRLPEVGSLPKPERVVSSAFDFLGHLLSEQRKFADDLLKATVALRPGADTKRAEPGATEPGAARTSATAVGAAQAGAAQAGAAGVAEPEPGVTEPGTAASAEPTGAGAAYGETAPGETAPGETA
jgi:hypothetical protein